MAEILKSRLKAEDAVVKQLRIKATRIFGKVSVTRWVFLKNLHSLEFGACQMLSLILNSLNFSLIWVIGRGSIHSKEVTDFFCSKHYLR